MLKRRGIWAGAVAVALLLAACGGGDDDNAGSSNRRDVIFDERFEGDYRIYAGALEAPRGQGYIAAVVVNRVRGSAGAPREAYRDDSLACGHRWGSPDEALSYAMNKAREVIHREQHRLHC